jgi:putative hemolysin
MKKTILVLAALAATSAFAVPNPASVFCLEQAHGKLQILSTQAGQAGFCLLDRAMIEEWTLFRGVDSRSQAQEAISRFLREGPEVAMERGGGSSAGVPNPASIYCEKSGGHDALAEDPQGNQYGICEFRDGSSIGEWTLFWGPDSSANRALMKVLNR